MKKRRNFIRLLKYHLYNTELQIHSLTQEYIRGICIDSPPVFIMGCSHSGTSLLLKILGSHSRIHAISFETKLAFLPLRKQKYLLSKFDKMTISAGKYRWVEKTPKHVHKIDILKELCPDAYIIFMIRDGRDVACSIKERTNDFDYGIKRWVSANRNIIKFMTSPNTFVLHYEDIIGDFKNTISLTTSFIGESFETEMSDFHSFKLPYQQKQKAIILPFINLTSTPHTTRNLTQLRTWQIHQPLFDGRGRWTKEMTDHEKEKFKHLAGDMLIELGYETNNTW